MAITTFNFLKALREQLHEDLGGFYVASSCTANGTTSTFIDSGLGGGDDFYNDKMFEFTSGANAGKAIRIVDWVDSTNTGTLLASVETAIAINTNYSIYEAGFFSDTELVRLANYSARQVFRMVRPEHLTEYLKSASATGNPVSGTQYGSVTLPSDRRGHMINFRIDDRPAAVLERGEFDRFNNDVFLDRAVLIYTGNTAYFKPKPEATATITFQYIPPPQNMVLNASVDWPEKIIQAVILRTLVSCWMKKERGDLADRDMALLKAEIDVLNGVD